MSLNQNVCQKVLYSVRNVLEKIMDYLTKIMRVFLHLRWPCWFLTKIDFFFLTKKSFVTFSFFLFLMEVAADWRVMCFLCSLRDPYSHAKLQLYVGIQNQQQMAQPICDIMQWKRTLAHDETHIVVPWRYLRWCCVLSPGGTISVSGSSSISWIIEHCSHIYTTMLKLLVGPILTHVVWCDVIIRGGSNKVCPNLLPRSVTTANHHARYSFGNCSPGYNQIIKVKKNSQNVLILVKKLHNAVIQII